MQQTQKILLYVLPLTFFIFGYRFPIGVLLYWLTTNVWSMGQQHFVIARMDATAAATAQAKLSNAPAGPAPGAKPVRPATAAPEAVAPPASSPNSPKPGGNRRPNNRSKKKRRR
jgi:YidC/Oxa1 family membrane protein insertase